MDLDTGNTQSSTGLYHLRFALLELFRVGCSLVNTPRCAESRQWMTECMLCII